MKKAIALSAVISLSLITAACADNENDGDNMPENMNGNNTGMENENEDNMNDHNENNMNENDEDHDNNDEMNDHNNDGDSAGHGHDDDQHEEFASEPENFNENAEDNLMHLQTKNVTRLDADNPVHMSVYVSQLIWPATHEDNQPGTVILAPVDEWQKSLAATTLIHHPNDGPVLFMEDGAISEEVMNEIERLNPKGNENGTEIMIMGDAGEDTLSQLESYETEQFEESSVPEFAADLDDYFAELSGEVPEAVLIASSEEEAQLFSLIAGSWIAHMNEPVLYVDDEGVPEATAQALERRDGDAYMYVLGPEEMITDETLEDLSEFGNVERIEGETPSEMSIAFAQYRSDDHLVGWGQEEPGHGFNFISTDNPEYAVTGAALGHLGKHAPVIWLDEGDITDTLYDYMADIRPVFEDDPMDGPYNHSYLLASQESVSFRIQGILDEKLEIAGEHGGH